MKANLNDVQRQCVLKCEKIQFLMVSDGFAQDEAVKIILCRNEYHYH